VSNLSPDLLGAGIAIHPPTEEANEAGSSGNTDNVSVPLAGSFWERQVMKQEEPPIRPRDWLKGIPFQPVAASDRLGWVELEAARYRASPAWE
jgi:hypothetical protein